MKKLLVSLAIILLVAMILPGCSSTPTVSTTPVPIKPTTAATTGATTTAPASTTISAPATSAYKWPDTIYVGVTSLTAGSYPRTMGWATVMEPATGMKIRVIPEGSDNTKSKMIANGSLTFDTNGLGTDASKIQADNAFATADANSYELRVGMVGGLSSLGFIVPADSGIKVPSDLKKGMKWAAVPSMGTWQTNYYALFAWANIDPKDMVMVPFSTNSAAVKAFSEGKVDLAYGAFNGADMIEVANGQRALKVINLDPKNDPAGAKRFLDIKGVVALTPCVYGIEQSKGITTVGLINDWSCKSDLDTTFVYNWVKWLVDNNDSYKNVNVECAQMDLKTIIVQKPNFIIPLHPGFIQYLKEKGAWDATDDARQKQAEDLTSRYVKAYKAAIADATAKGIKVDPQNADWLKLWNDAKKDIPIFKLDVK